MPYQPPSDPDHAGFSLLELMAVTAIMGILAMIATPFLASVNLNSNERVAAATLIQIARAQKAVAGAGIDSDLNGYPEYGFLQELSGVRNIRIDTDSDGLADANGPRKLGRELLPTSYGDVDFNGVMQRSGYLFRIYLPGDSHEWLREPAPLQGYPAVSGRHAEQYWACYAWPAEFGKSGNRAFFINQDGFVLACDNHLTRYEGSINAPNVNAIIAVGQPDQMDATIARDLMGNDGNKWRIQ